MSRHTFADGSVIGKAGIKIPPAELHEDGGTGVCGGHIVIDVSADIIRTKVSPALRSSSVYKAASEARN